MVTLIGMASGLLFGLWAASVWGLRKSRGVRPELLLVALAVLPILYIWGAGLHGWPTPSTTAESFGLGTERVDRALFAGTQLLTAAVAVAVLVRLGVTRRMERWARTVE